MRTQSAKQLLDSSTQNALPGGQKVDPDLIR